jgi:hypothetical protein
MNLLFLAVLNVIIPPLCYFLPFIAGWMLIRRLEKRLAEHIASWWFYGATISLIVVVTLESLAIPSVIPHIFGWLGNILTVVLIYLVYFFIIKVRSYLLNTDMYSQIKNHLGIILPFSVILIGLAYPFDKAPAIFYVAWGICIPNLFFVMFSYLELAWFFKRFKCSLWPLLVIEAIVGMGMPLQDLFWLTQLKTGILTHEEILTSTWPYWILVVSVIQGVLGTLPSIHLAIKLMSPLGVKSKEESLYGNAVNEIMKSANELLGSSAATIFTSTVEGFNRRFGKALKIKKEEEELVLSKMEPKEWPHFLEFLLSTFNECVGPITFKFAEGVMGVEPIVAKVAAKYT